MKVQGQISKYQGKFQITLKKLRLAAESEIDPTDLSAFDEVRCGGDVGGVAGVC